MDNQKNIFPIFDQIVGRKEKELLLNQTAKVIWMTGLSGSGKSTIAIALEKELAQKGFLTQVLDGDNIRTGINNNLGFSDADRTENIRRIAEVSKLFVNCGVITINCFVSPTNIIRNAAKEIIGAENFVEVFIDTPLEICEQRDVKGLYKKARAGEIKDFTGINAPFEVPENAAIIVKTANKTVEESVNTISKDILPLITKK
ncbi:MAG: adenylyl-sulfate kinase [Vicingaceae bacterium]|jgi:adenylylsulfate kinase|nr:adenylyl-sulfate kinase [Flavobacteriales bacterium]MDF1674125.1 adenylyl-sulfate kinase [Vicingaceae bacterium]|tara:strand:+ start:327319 stop:327924 length:606 start_codon:yes stop_codon:yes gene_type:complete